MDSAVVGTGSYTNSALGIMSNYYGSSIFNSGYVYIPIALAMGTDGFTAQNGMIQVNASLASVAHSAGGYVSNIAYGIYNSGSITKFQIAGPSASLVATGSVVVTLLLASSPPFQEF